LKEKTKWAMESCPERDNHEHKIDAIWECRCDYWLAGFNFAKEKMLDLCDATHSMVSYTEINRLGEKTVK
jgi:hypothetical protein